MMFAIEVNAVFSAAHQLRLPGGGVEPLHEHEWHVTVRVEAKELDELETVLDFHVVESALKAICATWHNGNLNLFEPFATDWNPSAERVAQQIGVLLHPTVVAAAGSDVGRKVRLAEVRVTEAPGCAAVWVG